MRKAYDFTILNNGEWMISHGGRLHGPYVTRGVALIAAKTAAMRAASKGHRSEISEQLEDGAIRTLWVHDDSAFDETLAVLAGE